MLGSVGRLGTLVVLGLLASPLVAQVPMPSVPTVPKITEPTSTGPGSQGWPVPLGQSAPTLAPQVAAPAPPSVYPQQAAPPLLEARPTAFVNQQQQQNYVLDQEGMTPLPGSLEENFNQEVAARRSLQYCTPANTRLSAFPSTLLWEPPLASKREARLQVMPTDYNNYVKKWTLETSIGTTAGILRIEPAGSDRAYQLDIFGVVHTRLSPDDLMASDYRFGLPVTMRWGNWSGKLGYEHTSAHLGDEYMRNTNSLPINFSKDEVVFGISRQIPELALRLYGTYSYAVRQDLLGDPNKNRYDGGFQWVPFTATGSTGSPYVAGHVESRGDQSFQPNYVAQAGWIWRNPYQRLANCRIYFEYYKGRSPYGQFYTTKENFYGVGLACDY